jgi:hypothetical protein
LKGNIKATSEKTGVPWSTIKYWSEGGAVNREVTKLRDIKKGDLADLFEQEAREALAHARETRETASYMQAMTAAGIAADKASMLREKVAPTPDQVQGVLDEVLGAIRLHLTDEAALGEIGALFSRLAQGISGGV